MTHQNIYRQLCFFLLFETTASIATGAFTHATERRDGALRAPHNRFTSASKPYFTKQIPLTKVNQTTKGTICVSVSYMMGEALTQKINTLYGLVTAVLDGNGDPSGVGVDAMLSTTSNTVNWL